MQNRYSERRSYARGTNPMGNLYTTDGVDTSHLKKNPVAKKKRSAFLGAATIVLKTGFVVLSLIAKGIKATAKMLIPARRADTKRTRNLQHNALPQENEL